MAIEIVDCPIKNGDFPWQNVSSPEGICGETHGVFALFKSGGWFMVASVSAPENDGEWCLVTP